MSQKYNHLFHLENTQENRDLIKAFNKNMKEHNSKWKFSIKYRKPKEGHKYGWGGSLKRENANEFAVYLNGGYTSDEMQEVWSRSGEAQRSLFMLTKKVDKVKELLEI
jgi:hypothetical protein